MNDKIIVVPEPDTDDTVKQRQAKQKAAILEELKRMPIIEFASKRAGIGRTTFYRWKKEDPEFAKQAEEAAQEGVEVISEMAESQLLSCIKDKELGAITFWLKHRDPKYSSKLEVKVKNDDEPLTDEQQELIRQALKLAGLENNNDPDRTSGFDKPDDQGPKN